VWYRRVEEKVGIRYEVHVYCGPVVNDIELDQPHCRTAEECARQILEDYKREVERLKEPPPPPPPDSHSASATCCLMQPPTSSSLLLLHFSFASHVLLFFRKHPHTIPHAHAFLTALRG
jgi:hypothetical protein